MVLQIEPWLSSILYPLVPCELFSFPFSSCNSAWLSNFTLRLLLRICNCLKERGRFRFNSLGSPLHLILGKLTVLVVPQSLQKLFLFFTPGIWVVSRRLFSSNIKQHLPEGDSIVIFDLTKAVIKIYWRNLRNFRYVKIKWTETEIQIKKSYLWGKTTYFCFLYPPLKKIYWLNHILQFSFYCKKGRIDIIRK